MSIASMTGFARAEGVAPAGHFAWELRSVNGKGLEARLRLPPGFERLEAPVRQEIQKRFARGAIQATLTVDKEAAAAAPAVNRQLLDELASIARRLADDYGVAPPTADGLLALRGVLEPQGEDEDEGRRATTDNAVMASLAAALDKLAEARAGEGRALEAVLRGHVDTIERLTLAAESDPSRDPATIRARLAEQVALLLDASSSFDEARLHAEAAFLATKADVREEIDRLKAHVVQARELIAAGGPVGRKLDFLSQEFIRESNTLCSKSNAASVTTIGLGLKAVVDQFREQVQNLE